MFLKIYRMHSRTLLVIMTVRFALNTPTTGICVFLTEDVMLPNTRFIALTLGLLLVAEQQRLAAQSTVTDVIGNQISVNVIGRSSFDKTSGLYSYTYTILSGVTSSEDVRYFALRLGGTVMPDVLNPTSPSGWTYHVINSRPIIRWGANSTSRIKPGQQLGGFSFQSHASPGSVTYYAKGYVQGPQTAPADLDDEHAVLIPDFTQIGVTGPTTGPISSATSGPPSVRGFVVIVAPADGSINAAPVQVRLKFGFDGEQVDQT